MSSAAISVREADLSNSRVVFQSSAELLREVQRRLASSPYRCVRNIECECDEGVVLLRGELPSYFFKQMAQELLREMTGCSAVENQIEVLPHAM